MYPGTDYEDKVMVGTNRGHLGAISGPFRGHAGAIFGAIFGAISGPFWGHFWVSCGTLGPLGTVPGGPCA